MNSMMDIEHGTQVRFINIVRKNFRNRNDLKILIQICEEITFRIIYIPQGLEGAFLV